MWFHDANLSGKLVPLFKVAVLVFLFLLPPYMFWLLAISQLRLFGQQYQAESFCGFIPYSLPPYKAKHYYWPDCCLHFILFLSSYCLPLNSILNKATPTSKFSGNWNSCSVGLGEWWGLQKLGFTETGVYRNWCLHALEGSLALNMIILSAVYIYHVGKVISL